MNRYFNLYGLIFVIVILIPNIVFSITCKDGFENCYQNRLVEILEQIGRFGCFVSIVYRKCNCLWESSVITICSNFCPFSYIDKLYECSYEMKYPIRKIYF